MNLTIANIHNHGNQSKEQVVLKATAACNLKDYLLSDSTYTPEKKLSNKWKHTFWFAHNPAALNKGDLVYLFTCNGLDSVIENADGTKSYLRYWGMNEAIWNDDEDCAVLFQISEHQSKSVK